MRALLTLIFLFITVYTATAADIPGSFSTAKKVALKTIYENHRVTFYCGCSFSVDKLIDSESCAYSPVTPPKESRCRKHDDKNCIEWEHVTPASQMGKHLDCWGPERASLFPDQCVKNNGKRRSGRDCCQRVNSTFKNAHNDLVNLTPAIGALNRARSDDYFGIIEGENRFFGQCDFESPGDVTEPWPSARGDIARIQLYMIDTYGDALDFKFDDDYLSMLYRWAAEDPISDWEIERNNLICNKQGRGNRYVRACPPTNFAHQ